MKFTHEQPNIWIKQLCAGEESAYKIFFDEYYQIFAHFAMRYIPDTAICEDIVHDVILDLYSNKKTFLHVDNFKSYLYSSIKNRCINYLEHRKVKEKYQQSISTTQNKEFFLDSIIEEEVYYLMHKAIKELPTTIQQIYELSLTGKTNEEIAQELSLTLDSVKAHKKRGKQILKEKLKNLYILLSVPL